jgi:protocatechuate 3,4-dioxygenase beta subunit
MNLVNRRSFERPDEGRRRALRLLRDKRFQGYGRFVTGTDGSYGFRTIKPVPYPGRTPHIHFKISRGGTPLLTTQCFVKGHPQNERDGLLRRLGDAAQREACWPTSGRSKAHGSAS